MNKWIITGVIAAVVIIGGGYYAFTQMGDDAGSSATSGSESTQQSEKSINALLAAGKPTKCTYTNESQDWTVYIVDGKFRGDYYMTDADGEKMGGHTINDGQYLYVWSDQEGTQAGVKMSIEQVNKARESADATSNNASIQNTIQETADYDEVFDMDCESWKADASQFVTPSNITFTDFGELMGGAILEGAVNAEAAAGGTMPTQNEQLDALRESTCKACDSLGGQDAENCKAELSCS